MSLNVSLNHSRSLKVIRNGTIRSIEYELLLASHSNYGPIMYHFRDKSRYWSKIAIFIPHLHSTPSLEDSRPKIAITFGKEKTRMVGPSPGSEKFGAPFRYKSGV